KFREHWIAKRAEWLIVRAANRDLREKQRRARVQRDAAKEVLDDINAEIQGIDAEIERLSIAILEHDNKTGRGALQQALKAAEHTAAATSAQFGRRLAAVRLLEPLGAMRGLGFDEHAGAIEKLNRLAKEAQIDRLPAGLAAAESAVVEAAPALMKRLDEARQKLFRDAAEQRERRDRIRDRIRQHAAGNANAHLADGTQELCRKLRQAGMAPRVLCDLVEVADPEGTAAAEGPPGRDREAIFVGPARIAQATALFKEGRREFRGATLVSLNKLENNRTPPQPGTFPTLFRSDDPDALAFIMRRYGPVRLALTLNAFNAPGRAIMKDGLYDDGLVRTHRASDPSGYKIGKTAQTKALRDLEDQAWQFDDAAEETGKLARAADGALGALKALSEDTGAALSTLAASYGAATKEQAEAIARISALDGTGDGGLRDKRRVQTEFKATRTSARDEQQRLLNKHEVEAQVCARKLTDG